MLQQLLQSLFSVQKEICAEDGCDDDDWSHEDSIPEIHDWDITKVASMDDFTLGHSFHTRAKKIS